MMTAGLSPAILGAAAVINSSHANNEPEVTCQLVIPKGASADGLECIVRQAHPVSEAQFWAVTGVILGVTLIVVASFMMWDRYSTRKFEERYYSGKHKRRK